ncbi:MAG: hypothetical protein HYU37_10100 [Acidobacteria bacterium]|nr:hypothetical protein [Acidobacteriota bacterium]
MTWPGRQVVLAGALGGAALMAVIFFTRAGSTSAATAAAARASRQAPVEATASIPMTDVHLELLEQTRPELGAPERNPFRFRPRPAPSPPRASAAPAPDAAAAVAPRPAAPPVPTGPPPIPLRFIGLFDAPGQAGRVAIMSDGRGNVFQGKEGDIIDGRYRVGRVTTDSLELSYSDGRGRQVIRLTGQ